MNLVIDVGNTFAKVAVFQNGEVCERLSVHKGELSNKIEDIFFRFPEINQIMVSKVSSARINFPGALLEKAKVHVLDTEIPLPFVNKYHTPHTLGNDRKALVAAATKYHPDKNVLVIDAGTCITYDFKDSENQFCGGAISPGLQMRFKALHKYTDKLPLVNLSEDFGLIGVDTETSIRSGVINGVLKELDGVIAEYREQFGDVVVIITGGDAQFLSRNLKNSIFANSNFLLEGLNHILEFNISQ